MEGTFSVDRVVQARGMLFWVGEPWIFSYFYDEWFDEDLPELGQAMDEIAATGKRYIHMSSISARFSVPPSARSKKLAETFKKASAFTESSIHVIHDSGFFSSVAKTILLSVNRLMKTNRAQYFCKSTSDQFALALQEMESKFDPNHKFMVQDLHAQWLAIQKEFDINLS